MSPALAETDALLAGLAAVARAALPRFGLAADAPLVLLHLRENAVFRVDDPAEARPLALRVHREGYRTAQEIRSELAFMDALREAGVATPEARPGLGGDPVQHVAVPGLAGPRDVDVLSWIEGAPLDVGAGPRAYRLLGATCARIQARGRTWTPPEGFRRPTWDAPALVGERALWGNYVELVSLEPRQRALLDRAAALVVRRLDAFGRAADRFGLTHGDLMPDNVLMRDGIPHVIDFDDCGFGWYLYDLATLLAVKALDPDRDAARDAWVEGYRSEASLPEAQLGELETLVMARGLLLVGWMHTRRETKTARVLTGAVVALACAQAEKLLASGPG